MYSMMMPPWFFPGRNEDMNYKDFFEFIKAVKEWEKSNEKKPDAPKKNDYWERFLDNWTIVLFFGSIYIVTMTTLILSLSQGHH